MLSSDLDLRKNSHLRLLQFYLYLDDEEIRKSQDEVILWFNSICESVKSTSLIVEVLGLSEEAEICNKIQEALLALHKRIDSFSVYLAPGTKGQELFSKLYDMGIVVEESIAMDRDKQVDHSIPTSHLSCSSLSFLALPVLPPMGF